MRYGGVSDIMRIGGVDARNELASCLVSEAIPFKTIPDFDPLSRENFKKIATVEHAQLAVDSYNMRVAPAVVNGSKLEVATKCQAQLPMEHKDRLRTKV